MLEYWNYLFKRWGHPRLLQGDIYIFPLCSFVGANGKTFCS